MNTQILLTLSNVVLAGLFTQVTGKETRRFESVKVGAKRVAEALAERGLTIEIEDGAPTIITQVAPPAPAPMRAVAGELQHDDHVTLRVVRAAPFDAHVTAFISAEDEAAEADREDEHAGERERNADDVFDARALVAEVRARITGKPAAIESGPGMAAKARELAETRHARARAAARKPTSAGAPGEPRGKSAALVAAARADAGVTNEDIRALTGWTKLGGFFGATQRAGLKLHRCREGSDTRWFGVPAEEAGVRAYTMADGRWIPVGQFETAADALTFAEAEATGQGVTVTMTEGDKGAVFLHTAAAQAAAA
jgi:hypothetical protein